MSTYKNDDGRWMVDVSIRLPGKRRAERVRRVSPVQTKRGADQYERVVRAGVVDGTFNRHEPEIEPAPTLAEWAETFAVEHSEAKHLRAGTIREQRAAFRLYLLPILGGSTPVDTIRTPHFDRVRRGIAARGLSPKTMNNALGVLSRAVRFYYERQGLDVPRFDGCRVRVPANLPKFWTPEEYESLLAAAAKLGPEILATLLLMGDCGLRTGEVLGLEWAHLSWRPEPQIVIQRTYSHGHWGPPKNGRTRTVPMTTRTATALRALPRDLRAPWVLTRQGPDGPTHSTRSALTWMALLAEREVNLARTHSDGQLHRLRHTYVTRLAAALVPVRTIMDLAGHRHLSTTMRYMHLIPGATSSGVAALERFDQARAAESRQDSGRAQGS